MHTSRSASVSKLVESLPFRCAVAGLALMIILAGLWESRAADVFLEATRPDFQKIPIGVVGFQDGTALAQTGGQYASILKKDLHRSRIFDVIDLLKLGLTPTGSAKPDEALLKEASDKGVSVLVWGQLASRQADVVVDSFAFDSGSNEGVIGKRYAGVPGVLRQMAHRFADELVYRYTGEPGIARTKIAYVSEHQGGREVFVMDYDGYGPRQVTADGFINLMPHWSPDRRFLVFTSYRTRERQLIDLVELTTGKRWPLIALPGLNITPVFSPDGSRLAFSTSRDGNAEIYTLEVRSKTLQRLTSDPGGDLSPTWSPTGRELAFTSDRGGGPQIYLMSADGSHVRRLTYDGDYNAAPAWSPRGTWIVYVCRTADKQYKLCLITPDGQTRLQITSGPGVDDSPSWSPDGRHVVFSSTREGKSHIYMMNADGTEIERLTSGGSNHLSPSWSPA